MANFYAFFPPGGGGGSNASVGTNGQTAPTSSTEIGGVNPEGNLTPVAVNDAGNIITVPASGSVQHVIVDSSALPTGAATQTTLATVSTTLGSILLDLTNGTQITQITGTVPLPTGAATSALQTTGNTSLASIDTKTPALGQALAAASVPVVLTAAQISTLTPLSTVTANQGTAGAGAWPVSVTSLPLPSGGSTSALQSNVQSAPGTPQTVALTIQGNASGIAVPISAAALPLPTGAATSANQTTANTSLSSIVTNTNESSSSSVTSVNGSSSSVQLLALNTSRKMAAFYNDSTSNLYLKLGTTASATSYTILMVPNSYYELPWKSYTGEIDGIWVSAAGAVRVTELS